MEFSQNVKNCLPHLEQLETWQQRHWHRWSRGVNHMQTSEGTTMLNLKFPFMSPQHEIPTIVPETCCSKLWFSSISKNRLVTGASYFGWSFLLWLWRHWHLAREADPATAASTWGPRKSFPQEVGGCDGEMIGFLGIYCLVLGLFQGMGWTEG